MPASGTIAIERWEQQRFALRPGLRHDLLVALLVACAYYAGTEIGFLFTPPGLAISLLWPPNALLFAALLLTAPRAWPLLLAAVLPAHLVVQLYRGIPLLTALGWFATNSGEALLGAASLRAYCASHGIPVHKLFKSTRGVASFILLGVILAPFLTSFLDIEVVVRTGLGHDFWALWSKRFFSNTLANVTVAPTVIALSSMRRPIAIPLKRYLELIALITAIVLVVAVVLGSAGSNYGVATLIYLILPLLLWAVVRFGSEGVSTSLLLVALLVIWNALNGRGSFGLLEIEVRSMQIFFFAISVPLLVLGAVVEERRGIEEQLRQHTRISSLVSQIAANFLNVNWDMVDDEINRGLKRLTDLLGEDWFDIFDLNNPELRVRHTVFVPAKVGPPHDKIAIERVIGVVEKMRLDSSMMIKDVEELPEGSEEREILGLAGAKSIAIVPLGPPTSPAGMLMIASVSTRTAFPADLLSELEILGQIFYDAVQRNDTFQALEESEQRFRYTADCSPMSIWMSDTNGLCTYFNQFWLEFTGVALQKQLGEGWTQLVHPEDVSECISAYKTAFAARRPFNVEYRLRRHDGEYRWMLDAGAPRFDAQGTFLGFVGSGFDITYRKRAEQALTGLSRKLMKAQEEERQRIARELHDDVGQRLTLMAVELDRLCNGPDSSFRRVMVDLLQQASEISDCVHNISHNLHSAGLDVLPLGIILKARCREVGKKTSIEMQFDEHGVPLQLPEDIKLCLYRVAQESLQNIVKHSQASRAKLELSGNEGGVTLIVEDDGIGFKPYSIDGLGIASMRERLGSLAGTIKITSVPMKGTRLEIYVPLPQAVIGSAIKLA